MLAGNICQSFLLTYQARKQSLQRFQQKTMRENQHLEWKLAKYITLITGTWKTHPARGALSIMECQQPTCTCFRDLPAGLVTLRHFLHEDGFWYGHRSSPNCLRSAGVLHEVFSGAEPYNAHQLHSEIQVCTFDSQFLSLEWKAVESNKNDNQKCVRWYFWCFSKWFVSLCCT